MEFTPRAAELTNLLENRIRNYYTELHVERNQTFCRWHTWLLLLTVSSGSKFAYRVTFDVSLLFVKETTAWQHPSLHDDSARPHWIDLISVISVLVSDVVIVSFPQIKCSQCMPAA